MPLSDERPIHVVSDDAAVRDSIVDLLASVGINVNTFDSLPTDYDVSDLQRRGCLVLDTHDFDLSSAESQSSFAAVCAAMTVILLNDRGDVPMAVIGLKCGAIDVVQKPYQDRRLLDSIIEAMDTDRKSVR